MFQKKILFAQKRFTAYLYLVHMSMKPLGNVVKISKSITPNVSLEYAPPDSLESMDNDDFMGSKRKE